MKMADVKRKRCAYRPCPVITTKGTSYFVFPKDLERSKTWLRACNREDLLNKSLDDLHKNYVVCEKHFEDSCFSRGPTRKHLFANAVPTIFLNTAQHVSNIPSFIETCSPPAVLAETITTQQPESSGSIPGPIKHFFEDENQPSTSKGTPLPSSSLSVSSQTPSFFGSHSPRKEKLRKKLKATRKLKRNILVERNEDLTVANFQDQCYKFLNKPLAEIISEQALLKDKSPSARRYSSQMKQFALTLYFLGPRAYSFMSTVLCLPTNRCLQKITENLVTKPGLENSEVVFKALEIKAQTMTYLDMHMTVCVDEMALKSHLYYHTGRDEIVGFHDVGSGTKNFKYAQNVLVIMARGLYTNWKQPLAYFFLSSQFEATQLQIALESCVAKLTNLGFFVDGVVSDMGSNFISLATQLGVNSNNPEIELAGQKLLFFFDPCHLLKATRTNLLKYIIKFGDKKTSWAILEKFFEQDSKQFYKNAPKLTKSHLQPTNFEKMKVKLAAQILSHTVASSLNLYMTLGALPSSAVGTIEFIEAMNNLFDVLNSSSTDENHEYKKVFVGSQFQIDFLDKMIAFIKNIKVLDHSGKDITGRMRFRKCWLVTIKGLKLLWVKLSAAGFKYLKTRRLNSDCLENFFGSVRQQSGNSINPTPVQFERAFKKLFCQSYLHSSGMSCNEDLDNQLIKLDGIKTAIHLPTEGSTTRSAISLPDYDYRREDILVQNPFKYVCGYLIKKALGIHKCDVCIKFSKECEELDTSQLLTYFKAYDTKKSIYGGLRTPNEKFINYIYQLEKIFTAMFSETCLKTEISHSYLDIMKNVEFCHPCNQFPKMYMIKLFIRCRIFYSLKFANRDIRDNKKDKKNRKVAILSHL